MSAKDKQIAGSHYQKSEIQPIDFILKNNLGFCEGNIVKYITRYKYKNGIEDLLKAQHYVEFLIEQETEKNMKLKNRLEEFGVEGKEMSKIRVHRQDGGIVPDKIDTEL